MKLTARHITLLRRIVEAQELVFPKCGKLLGDLEEAGFIFIKDIGLQCFGDYSVKAVSGLEGEDFLRSLDNEDQ